MKLVFRSLQQVGTRSLVLTQGPFLAAGRRSYLEPRAGVGGAEAGTRGLSDSKLPEKPIVKTAMLTGVIF